MRRNADACMAQPPVAGHDSPSDKLHSCCLVQQLIVWPVVTSAGLHSPDLRCGQQWSQEWESAASSHRALLCALTVTKHHQTPHGRQTSGHLHSRCVSVLSGFYILCFSHFPCLAFSTTAFLCHIIVSRNYMSRIFSTPKSSIMSSIKSTTSFPTSYGWSVYDTP